MRAGAGDARVGLVDDAGACELVLEARLDAARGHLPEDAARHTVIVDRRIGTARILDGLDPEAVGSLRADRARGKLVVADVGVARDAPVRIGQGFDPSARVVGEADTAVGRVADFRHQIAGPVSEAVGAGIVADARDLAAGRVANDFRDVALWIDLLDQERSRQDVRVGQAESPFPPVLERQQPVEIVAVAHVHGAHHRSVEAGIACGRVAAVGLEREIDAAVPRQDQPLGFR